MVDVPLEVMEPTHNKQSFANVKQYNRLLKSMESYLLQYWKDIGISQKGEFVFWNDFGYLGAKWNDKPSDTVQYKRRRAVEIPDIVQCALDRKLPHQHDGQHRPDLDCEALLGGQEEADELAKLSPDEQQKRLKAVINKIYLDLDGFLTEAELNSTLEDAEEESFWRLPLKDKRRFEKANRDGASGLNLNEFIAFEHPEEAEYMKKFVIQEAFEDHDENSDGFVSLEEFLDICLKWRLLSLDTDINNEGHHDIWTCGENKCHVPENLPSVPLGTILPSSESLNDKLLADSIQQCQSKQKNLPLQNFYWVEPHTVVPHTEDYRTIKDKNETIKKTVSWRKAVHKDPSPACSRLIKNSANKRRLRPLEVQDKQPLKKEPDVIKTETDKMTEIIISDSESEDLPKYEDFAFIPKADEKQEQYDDKADVQLDLAVYATPEEKDLCQTDSESGSTEKSKGQSQEEQALVDRQNSEVAASPTREPSHENKMIETLTDLIK
uniref:Uncharacterized protein n=1 Tax=Sphaerodactylus townsendi TaxID=933632 RepID=A0ACB8FHC0_9SAUR